MKLLSKYTPAETLVLLEGKKADIKELLKTTFMDLLLKQVLVIECVSKKISTRDDVRVYKYIARGKNFLMYKSSAHEWVYLSPFYKSSSIKILFQHLIRMGFQNAKTDARYIASVIKSPNVNYYFRKNLFQKLFGAYRKCFIFITS